MDIPSALRRRPHRGRRGLPRQPLPLPSTFDSPRVLAGLTLTHFPRYHVLTHVAAEAGNVKRGTANAIDG